MRPRQLRPMPTLRAFIQTAEQNHGVKLMTTEVIGPKGRTEIRALVRRIGDVDLIAVLPDQSIEDERLRPSTVRSLCRRLAIDVTEFGLVADKPQN